MGGERARYPQMKMLSGKGGLTSKLRVMVDSEENLKGTTSLVGLIVSVFNALLLEFTTLSQTRLSNVLS